MKLKKISIIVIAAALVSVIGAVITFITIKTHSNFPKSNTLAATPVTQNTSNPAVKADLPELNGAKSVSNAKDLIESATEGEFGSNNRVSKTPSDQSASYFYRSFIIRFKQDMDASTLNSQNIHAYIDNDPTKVNCNYNAESRELQIDIRLDAGQGDLNTATIYVLLTKNIKTADGKSIGDDYVYSVANNK